MNIDEFIESTSKITQLDKLEAPLVQAIGAYGYNSFTWLSEIGPEISEAKFPPITEYFNRSMYHYDPVLHLCFTQQLPFIWDSIDLTKLDKRQQETMEFRYQNGLLKGLSVPIWGMVEDKVGVSMASNMSDARTDEQATNNLTLIAHQYSLRYATLKKFHK